MEPDAQGKKLTEAEDVATKNMAVSPAAGSGTEVPNGTASGGARESDAEAQIKQLSKDVDSSIHGLKLAEKCNKLLACQSKRSGADELVAEIEALSTQSGTYTGTMRRLQEQDPDGHHASSLQLLEAKITEDLQKPLAYLQKYTGLISRIDQLLQTNTNFINEYDEQKRQLEKKEREVINILEDELATYAPFITTLNGSDDVYDWEKINVIIDVVALLSDNENQPYRDHIRELNRTSTNPNELLRYRDKLVTFMLSKTQALTSLIEHKGPAFEKTKKIADYSEMQKGRLSELAKEMSFLIVQVQNRRENAFCGDYEGFAEICFLIKTCQEAIDYLCGPRATAKTALAKITLDLVKTPTQSLPQKINNICCAILGGDKMRVVRALLTLRRTGDISETVSGSCLKAARSIAQKYNIDIEALVQGAPLSPSSSRDGSVEEVQERRCGDASTSFAKVVMAPSGTGGDTDHLSARQP